MKSDEDNRMARNPLEYIRCKEIIYRFLNKESMNILDIGGATGAFSFWLAQMGHKVTLYDLTLKHIEITNKRQEELGIRLSSCIIGDARNLPFENNSFDLALLMGPLYHLIDRSDRIIALTEAKRVLKPGGRMICEAISRYASMIDGFLDNLISDPEFVDIMNRDIQTGIHIDTSSRKTYFTDSYFHKPAELESEIIESGFQDVELIAVTSFGVAIDDIELKINDEKYKQILLDTIRMVEKDPDLMGFSSHIMGIGSKNTL